MDSVNRAQADQVHPGNAPVLVQHTVELLTRGDPKQLAMSPELGIYSFVVMYA
jgi:hypothetical protein